MLKAAATLEDRGPRDLAMEPDRMKPATGIMRFAYATGSRPLDGYTIKRGVGVGGFGEVYFALSDAGKEVAIKRIQRNLDIEIRGVSQCLNLKHPHLVAIYDIRYDDEGQAWVVMEYVRGASLKDVLDGEGNGLSLADALRWFHGIAAGVRYLHDHGIVHRDLKPGNVFLDESVVKVGDYGLSKYISCSRRSGQTESVGTFHYMAPEIGRGVYGKEIDVYALGIMLYEMLTGRVPFDGESSHEIIMKHLTASPDLAPLPEKLRPIVQRALFKDPEKRFRSVGDMAEAVAEAFPGTGFDAIFGGMPVAHRPAGAGGETIYIGEPTEADGIFLGPLKQRAAKGAVNKAAATAAIHDEPIARAVRGSWRDIVAWWNGPHLTRTARIVLGVVIALVVSANAGWLLPLLLVLASGYLVYFGLRLIVLSVHGTPSTPERAGGEPAAASPLARTAAYTPAPAKNVPAAAPAEHQPAAVALASEPVHRASPRRRRRWSEVAQERLRGKAAGERLTELTGSMLVSTVVVAVVSLLALIAIGLPVDGSIPAMSMFTWLCLTSLLATWSILIPSKLWEGVEGDQVARRFFQLLVGLVMGTVAFGLNQYLDPHLPARVVLDMPQLWGPPPHLFAGPDLPLPTYLTYFAGLFLLVRWWRYADPMRPHRFSLWGTALSLGIALAWQMVWPFPQPWSLLVPGTVAIALQLSSPWINSGSRNEFRKLAEA